MSFNVKNTIPVSASSVQTAFVEADNFSLVYDGWSKNSPVHFDWGAGNLIIFMDSTGIKKAAENGVLFDMGQAATPCFFRFSDVSDTAESARYILSTLGLRDQQGRSILLRFYYTKTNAGGTTLTFQNGSGTSNNVKVELNGATSHEQVIGVANATAQNGEVIIQVEAEDTTPGSEVVVLRILRQAVV